MPSPFAQSVPGLVAGDILGPDGIVGEGREVQYSGAKVRASVPPMGALQLVSLLFDRDRFTLKQAQRWARERGHPTAPVRSIEDHWILLQAEPTGFYPSSFRVDVIDEGVCATRARPKPTGRPHAS